MTKWRNTVQHYARPRRAVMQRKLSVPSILTALLLVSAAGAGFTSADSSPSLSLGGIGAMLPGSGCNIKGNISLNTDERIFHVPGQKYYQETRVSVMRGERWFCSEGEARKAGWRRSRV